jgi:putative flippase GtrA
MEREKIFKVAKYIISGGTAAVVDLFFLYIFVEKFGLWYVFSAILAFLIAFSVSFSLQKFWTFKDTSTDKVHKQASVYFIVSVVNLGLNTLLMYIFVDIVKLHYFPSQILAGGLLAISSFFIYSRFIFSSNSVAQIILSQEKNNLE